ncbi:uncharacterized protein LOC114522881 [Dendronephthya gigantea]|uniref:uncharacterized protein LOC114522881 n=1 Tax=Dendronephthya gigantea TaxID=151771 RepID=UPI00106AFD78|nr:uncharacterized protein LOC114522881 [Dendronephthya gigantea]
MTANLIIRSFLFFLSFVPAAVLSANFTTIRVPLSIAPIVGIPREDFKDAEVAREPDLYSKATIYDDLTLSVIYDLNRVLDSSMSSVISNIFVLEERKLLDIDLLFAYNCTRWCLDLPISEMTRVTGKTMENLKGNPDRITVLDLHNLIVQTLEDIYCFKMDVIEQRLNKSSKFLVESEWALFVPQIVAEAVKCKADILGVTVSELAELLRTDVATLLGFTLSDVSNTFFPNFLLLQSRKNLFETRSLDLAYLFAGLTSAEGEAKTMLFYASHSTIAFNLRDLEILYDWEKPQLFAIDNVPLSSYFAECSVITSNSLFAVSKAIFGQGATEPTCNVSYVLSRSLDEVENKFNTLTTIENRNSLYIFMTATDISSWFVMDGILQLDIDEGIWVEIPSVSHVASADGKNTTFIKTCSLPQVIALLKSTNESGTLTPFLTINNPSFRNLLLATYGYTYNELVSLTGTPSAQISSLPVVDLHAMILDALVDRYSISDLPSLLGVPGVVNMRILSTLPSFEWSRIVRSVIQGSFAHAADALSVNLAAGSHVTVTNQADGNPSIGVNPSPVYFSPKVTTNTLATCLLARNEADIYAMTLPNYHTLFRESIIPIVQGKITIESTPFESLLSNDDLILRQVWNRTVADVIAQYTGLSVPQLGCLYGWDQNFLNFINGTTWEDVSAFRLCSEYEKMTLHEILVLLLTAPKVNCFATISLSASNYNVDESGRFVVVLVELSGGEVDKEVKVILSVTAVSATAGKDFEDKEQTNVTFAARDTQSKPVIINILEDDILENNEQFLVFITSTDSDTRLLISSATVTIKDNDFVSISWQVPDNSVSENIGLVTANLVLNGDIEKSIAVNVAVNDISTSTSDYALLTPSVTFNPSDNSKTKQVLISITNDGIVEPSEALELLASTTDVFVNTTNTVILIEDNDKIIVSFVQSTYTFSEGILLHQIEVNAVAPQLTTDVPISLSTFNDGASAGLDYINANTLVTFTPFVGSQIKSFSVSILPDTLVELDETFEVNLAIPTGSADLAQLSNPSKTIVTIQDDDKAVINFKSATYSVLEQITEVNVTVTLTGALGRPVSIGYTTQTGTASSADFTANSGTLTFNPSQATEQVITISIANDNFVEASEQFKVILLLQDPVNTEIGNTGQTTVTILDDDKALVEHVKTSYTFPEDGGPAILGVRLLNLAGPLQTNVDVSVAALGTTASTNDFTPPNSTLTFFVGDFNNERNISIPIIDDNLFEVDEAFLVILSAGTDNKVEIDPPSQATVTITSEDDAVISFTQNSYSVTEGQTVPINLQVSSGTLGSSVTVSVSTQDVSTSSTDFGRPTLSVTFAAGETGPKTVNILTTDDDIVEANEIFTVSLSSSSGVTLGGSAFVTINNDDDVTVQFTTSSSTVSEGSGSTSVQLVAVEQREIDVIVSVTTQAGTASADVDYDTKTEVVTFKPTDTFKTVDFTVRDDTKIEEEESFKLVLSAISGQVTIGSVDEHTIKIEDDDFATVQFTSEVFSGNETFGYADIWVVLTGVLEDPTSVSVSTTQDTALAGIDYSSLTNSPLAFTPGGPTLQRIRVNITDDVFIEGTERFKASLSTTNSFTKIGSVNETTVRIIDDDVATLGFASVLNLEVNEGSPAVLTAQLTGPLTTQVSATATVVLVSASNDDFDVISSTNLNFSPGDAQETIAITTDGDVFIEGNEVFQVILSTSSPNVQVDDGVTTITILDDDDAEISLAQNSYQGSEDSSVVEVSINLSGDLKTTVQARLTLSPQSAVLGDYAGLVDPVITFSPSSPTTQRRNITIVNDDAVENLEFFRVDLEAVGDNVKITPISSATVTITDNDKAIFGFQPINYALQESAPHANLSVVLFSTTPLQRTVMFRYSTINQTAKSPGDYDDIINGQLQFDVGDGNGAVRFISVGINDDVIIESPEIFQVELTAVASDTISANTATVTIIDNDVPSIRLIDTTKDVNEGDVQLSVRVLLTGTVDREVTARLTTSNVTASANSDYQPIDQEITFPVGNPFVEVKITINQDTLVEGAETFEVTLTSDDANVENPKLTVTILDNDFVTISFQNNAADVPENSGLAIVNIQLSGDRAVPITFDIDTIAASALKDQDYVYNRREITINPSDSSSYVETIQIKNDQIVEGDEVFSVTIDDSSPLVTYDGSNMLITIKDDDTANVTFSKASYTFNEDVNQTTVNIEIDRNLQTTATVTVSSTANTATSGFDFTSIVNQAIVFGPGDSTKSLVVTIKDDNIVETDELFTLSLSTAPGSALRVGSPGTTLISIDDNDVASVEMNSQTYTSSEDDDTTQVQVKLNALAPIERELTFSISTKNGSALSPRDFTHLEQVGRFSAGLGNGATLSISIDISDDVVVENTEDFYVQLAEIDSALQVANPNRSIVYIQDNDAFEAQFTHGDLSVNEEDGNVRVSVRLNGQHEREVTIRLNTVQNTATPGSDYTTEDINLRFPAGDSSKTVDIEILNDLVIEGTETFRVTITSGDPQVKILEPQSITVSIIDTDVATVSFNQSEYRVNEDVGSSALWVELKNELQINSEVKVEVYNFPDTAKTPADYSFASPTSTILTFRGGETKLLPIPYTVNDDDHVENAESFYGLINADRTTVVAVEPLLVRGFIEDNDVAIVGFTQAEYPVNENQDASVVVELQNTLSVSVTVSIKTTIGNAESADFGVITKRDITFDPGQSSKTVDIQIINDGIVENDESFIVSLETTHPRVQFNRSEASVKIIDDDNVSIRFQKAQYIVNEDDGSVQVSCQIIGSTAINLNYLVHIEEGSARRDSDFTGATKSLLIQPGTTENTINVPLVNDDNIESNETFSLRMDNLNNARIVLANPSTTTILILDDDAATVEFSQRQYSVLENGVSVTVTLNLTGVLDQNTTVSVSSFDVTATAGQDYTEISRKEIKFSPGGPTEQEIVIPINNDTLLEGTESFLLSVSSQNAYTRIGENANTTVRIIDDDVVSVDFVITTDDVNEQDGAIVVEIEIQGTRTRPVTVSLESFNLLAVAASDFTAVDSTVTFQPSESKKLVSVFITNDDLIENDETFLLRLSTDDNQVKINDNQMTIKILDNDEAAIRFEQTSYTFDENDGEVTLGILLAGNLGISVSADVQFDAQTADLTDYTPPQTRTVVFTPGSNRADVKFNITDDDVVETTELFSAKLEENSPKVVLGSPSTTTIGIRDNDNAQVRFLVGSKSVDENAGNLNMTIELVTVFPLQRDVSVRFSTEEGTAQSPEDFSNVAGSTVIFNAGDSNGETRYGIVPIEDDDIVEDPESFTAKLTSIDSGLTTTTFTSTVISIIDDDKATVRFIQSTYSVNEPATSVNLLVQLTGTITRTVTARITTANIDAIGGNDYGTLNRLVTFTPGGGKIESIPVTIDDDAIVENNERFRATLTADNGVTVPPDGATTTVSIIDNDDVTVTLEALLIDVNEASNNAIVLVKVTGTRERDIHVNVSTYDISAFSVLNDYTKKSELVTLEPNSVLKQFLVSILEDTIVESTEQFGVRVTSTDPQVNIVNGDLRVSIADNDRITLTMRQSTYAVDEDDIVVLVHVNVTGQTAIDIGGSKLSTSAITAGSPGDYTNIERTILVTPSSSTFTVSIPIQNDGIIESDETFRAILSTTNSAQVDIGTPSFSLITIKDDDALFISFEQPNYIVSENDGTITVGVVVTGSTSLTLEFGVTATSGSATTPADYILLQSTVELTPGVAKHEISVRLTNDLNLENNETFTLNLNNKGDTRVRLLGLGQTTILIMDDDAATIQFTQDLYPVNENDKSVQVVLNIVGVLDQPATVWVSSRNNSALAGIDYDKVTNQEVTFVPGGPTNQTLNVTIIDDNILEGTESFYLDVSSSVNNIKIGDRGSTTIRIVDDDSISVEFVKTRDDVLESNGVLPVDVAITGQRSVNVVAKVKSNNLGAIAGADYNEVDETITFLPNETQPRRILVIIRHDVIVENDEQFVLLLSTETAGVTLGDNVFTATIKDDDFAVIRLEKSSYTVNESISSLKIGVIMDGQHSIAIDANVALTPVTAVVGDYLVGNGDVTFDPGETKKEITVFIPDDEIVEALESFEAKLTGDSHTVVGTPREATVFIQDNDVSEIRFEINEYSVNEADQIVNLTVVLLTVLPLGRDASFSFVTQDGTAVSSNNVDFDKAVGSIVVFQQGSSNYTTKQISVSIIDDSRTESTESFSVELSAVTGGGLVPVNPSSATVNIVDDDNAILMFAPDSYTIVEGSGTVSVIIVRIGAIERDVSAFLTLQSGTATVADYTGVPTVVTFTPIDLRKTVSITIKQDVIVEGTESFTAGLTAVSGATIPEDGKSATITILDDDVLTIVMEAVPTTVIDEDGDSVTVNVRAVGGLQREINLNVFTYDITAAAGDDYVSKNEIITLNSTKTIETFVVAIRNDNVVENTETFGVNVSTSEQQVELQDETVVISIRDEDKLTLSIAQGTYTVQEDAGSFSVNVTVSGTTDVLVTGSTLTTRNGAAVSPGDYEAKTQSLFIVPGQNSPIEARITVNDDQLTEGNENFILELSTSNANQISIGRSTAVVTIEDDDVATVQFVSNRYYVNETNNSTRLGILLSGNLAQPVLVGLNTAQDTASAGLDYVQVNNLELTYTPGGDVLQYVDITILNDDLIEGSEDFTAGLTPSPPLVNLGTIATTTVTIIDDDVAGIGFALSNITVPENGGTVQIAVESTGGLNTTVTVSVTVTGSTASSNDYTVSDNIIFTFSPTGPSRQHFNFTPNDDPRIEGDEVVLALLSTTDPQAEILTRQIRITIQDDDKAIVRLDKSSVQNTEGSLASINVLLTGELDKSVTVNLKANGLTATKGDDFTFADQSVVFQPGDTQQTRLVVINGDNVVEPTEFFNVVLTSTDGNVQIGTPSTTVVTIEDDDEASLYFSSGTYLSSEVDKQVTLTVVLATNAPLQREVTASFTLSGLTAVSPEDFPSNTNATVTFNVGDSNSATRDLVISVEDDDIVEPTQTFTVTIVTSDEVLNPGTATVFIEDDDDVSVRFVKNPYYFEEDEVVTNVNVLVLSTSPLQKSITIGIASEQNSAIAGEDYISLFANNTIVISPSDGNEKDIPVEIKDDSHFEDEENFRIRLSTTDPSVKVISPELANVFITDDDDAVVGFQQEVYWTTEDSENVEICVSSSIQLHDNIIVTVSTIAGTASTLDFVPVAQQLTLTSTAAVCLNVTLKQDLLIEGNETFSVQLTTANPRVQIPKRVAFVHIVDDDVNECRDATDDCHPTRAICSDTEDSFTCTCRPGYTGDGRTCEDIDECAEKTHSCDRNANCTNTIGGYECHCHAGYTGDGFTCTDIIECNPNPNQYPCHRFSFCNDTMGSFVCWCPAGFVGDGYNFCNDTNECELGTHNCASVAACENTRGSYICRCPRGFFGDGKTCVDVNECADGTDLCHDNAWCNNTIGSYSCTCKTGYDGNGRVCNDVNECSNHPCDANATCNNTDGSFNCVCKLGFTGDGLTCSDINECNGNPCHPNATCDNTLGSYDCECKTGFTGDGRNNCQDKHECNLGTDNCHVNANCVNNIGSFMCTCLAGFTGDGVSCRNINECDTPNVCNTYATCNDTQGSFTCTCNSGFTGDGKTNCADIINCIPTSFDWPCHQRARCEDKPLGSYTCTCDEGYTGDGAICDDIDECTQGLHDCSEENSECVNEPGTFRCQCKDGYILDGKICIDFNECNDTSLCNVTTSTCVNLQGSHKCICKDGFTQTADDQDCYDLNECNNSTDNNCHENANCINTFGSFNCTCLPGFVGDGVTCLDNDECKVDPCHSNAKCDNTPGSYTCSCKNGFTGDGINNCSDINECPGACVPILARCTNSPGSFNCECIPGYTGNGENSCVDINECENQNPCSGGTCENTIGNFTCTCTEGYNLQGNVCVDIDECLQPGICTAANSKCKNYDGSFNCECNPGYEGLNCIDIDECAKGTDDCHEKANCTNIEGNFTCQCDSGYTGDGRDCKDIDECAEKMHNCHPNATCNNVIHPFSCHCKQGFSGDGVQCPDINECESGTADCADNATCTNILGSFKCACNNGFTGDGKVCDDIPECNGSPCDVNAECLEEQGGFSCRCKIGYTGDGRTSCEDIKECDTDPCHPNANCTELPGSYECKCNSGYIGNGTACDDVDECRDRAFCHANAKCENTIGSYNCTCASGYEGDGKMRCDDIDECMDINKSDCDDKANCTNKNGTFDCTCNQGYSGDGKSCSDINECRLNTDNCHGNATCTNEEGSYTCACDPGFTGNGILCEDIPECSSNTHNCHENANCTEVAGSFTCSCKTGYTGNGTFCEDINECDLNTDNCDVNANCTNIKGSYTCACNPGFTGSGTKCEDINECESNPCGATLTCENTYGSHRCNCPRGQNYVDDVCKDVLVFNLQFVITNVTYSDALGNSNSEEHLKLKHQLENSVNKVYSRSAEGEHYIESARLEELSKKPADFVTANFRIFFNTDVRDMSMTDVQDIFVSNVTHGNKKALEPRFELDSINAGDYDECKYNPSVCDADKLCRNYPGTYRCYCSSPREVKVLGECTAIISYEASITINLSFVTELGNATSLIFLQLAEEIQVQLNRYYRSLYPDTFQSTQVTGMSSGSVVIQYLVFFKTNANVTQNGASLTKELSDAIIKNGSMLGRHTVNTSKLTHGDYDECHISNLVDIKDCDKNANCTNVMSSYTCVCNEGYYGDGIKCSALEDPNPPIDDLWWLVYAIVFGVAFLIIVMFILFVCCLENAEESQYMVDNTTLVDRNRYFFGNESVGIENPDIEMSARNGKNQNAAIYTTSPPQQTRLESYKVNPMFYETKSQAEQSSVGGKSSVSTGQEGYIAL